VKTNLNKIGEGWAEDMAHCRGSVNRVMKNQFP
jgi:hypothetical protein